MSFNEIILWITALGILLGALDKIFGNRFGLGEKFDEGFHAMGPLALGMVGIVCLAPTLSRLIGPAVVPLCTSIGIDPALFGCILANDMGGYSLSAELAVLPEAGQYFGLIVASMLGCTLVFSIPVGLGIINKEDRPFFSRGLLIGFITIPVGSLVGGLAAGFDTRMLLVNTIPIIILALLPAIGLLVIPRQMIKGCTVFGQIITIIIYIGLACAAFEHITDIVLIPYMAPITDALMTVAEIGIVLLGVFPLLSVLCKILDKPLKAAGKKLGLDPDSIAGIIVCLANPVPVFGMMKSMKKRGIIINTAFLVSATACLGDHLGFTAGVAPEMIGAMVAGKLTSGIIAAVIAYLSTGSEPD